MARSSLARLAAVAVLHLVLWGAILWAVALP